MWSFFVRCHIFWHIVKTVLWLVTFTKRSQLTISFLLIIGQIFSLDLNVVILWSSIKAKISRHMMDSIWSSDHGSWRWPSVKHWSLIIDNRKFPLILPMTCICHWWNPLLACSYFLSTLISFSGVWRTVAEKDEKLTLLRLERSMTMWILSIGNLSWLLHSAREPHCHLAHWLLCGRVDYSMRNWQMMLGKQSTLALGITFTTKSATGRIYILQRPIGC